MKGCWVCKPRKKAIYVDSEGDYYCQDCFDRFKQGSFKWKHGKPTKLIVESERDNE